MILETFSGIIGVSERESSATGQYCNNKTNKTRGLHVCTHRNGGPCVWCQRFQWRPFLLATQLYRCPQNVARCGFCANNDVWANSLGYFKKLIILNSKKSFFFFFFASRERFLSMEKGALGKQWLRGWAFGRNHCAASCSSQWNVIDLLSGLNTTLGVVEIQVDWAWLVGIEPGTTGPARGGGITSVLSNPPPPPPHFQKPSTVVCCPSYLLFQLFRLLQTLHFAMETLLSLARLSHHATQVGHFPREIHGHFLGGRLRFAKEFCLRHGWSNVDANSLREISSNAVKWRNEKWEKSVWAEVLNGLFDEFCTSIEFEYVHVRTITNRTACSGTQGVGVVPCWSKVAEEWREGLTINWSIDSDHFLSLFLRKPTARKSHEWSMLRGCLLDHMATLYQARRRDVDNTENLYRWQDQRRADTAGVGAPELLLSRSRPRD